MLVFWRGFSASMLVLFLWGSLFFIIGTYSPQVVNVWFWLILLMVLMPFIGGITVACLAEEKKVRRGFRLGLLLAVLQTAFLFWFVPSLLDGKMLLYVYGINLGCGVLGAFWGHYFKIAKNYVKAQKYPPQEPQDPSNPQDPQNPEEPKQ